MKKYDPYKRLILFALVLVEIVGLTICFGLFWYHHFIDMMYVVAFYRKGNYFIIAFYAAIMLFFLTIYGGNKIGQSRRFEVILSQFIGIFFADLMAYMLVSLLAYRLVNVTYFILMLAIDYVIAAGWGLLSSHLYQLIFKPWKILLIYGNRPAVDLVYKVDERRDKYAIYEAIQASEGIEKIAEKMQQYEAVIIGDISAVERNDLLKYCYGHGIRAYVVPKLSDILLMGTSRIHVFDTPFLLSKGYALSEDERFVKRMVDLILALILTVLTSPFMLLVALAIKIEDGGPVLYKQTRCTENKREFSIYKFRSMIVDAEKGGKAQLATKNDTRITRVGKVIRATRLDELPQLFNILKGDMSFVGPRPERPEIMAEYEENMPEFAFRCRVKAGLTGLAQVYGKYNTTPYDKLKLDLFYIENYSIWRDLRLIMMTVKIMLMPDSTEGIKDGEITAAVEASKEDISQAVDRVNQQNAEE